MSFSKSGKKITNILPGLTLSLSLSSPSSGEAGAPPKVKMGKKKSDIYSCFEILPMKNKANKSIFMCKFCDRQYLQNATKMESHIVTQCQKVPPNVRVSYAKVPGGGPRRGVVVTPMTSTSSPASDYSAGSRPATPVVGGNSKNRPVASTTLSSFNLGSVYEQIHQRQGKVSCNNEQIYNNNNNNTRVGVKRPGAAAATVVRNHNLPKLCPSPQFLRNKESLKLQQRLGSGRSQVGVNLSSRGRGQGLQGLAAGQKRLRLADVEGLNLTNRINMNSSSSGGGAATVVTSNRSRNHYTGSSSNKIVVNSNNNNHHTISNNNTISANISANGNIDRLLKRSLLSTGNRLEDDSNFCGVKQPRKSACSSTQIIPSMGVGGVGVLEHEEMADIWRLLAQGIYATGCPLSIFENKYWTEAMEKMRPSLTLPSTFALSNTLLGEEYLRIRRDVQSKINAQGFVTLHCQLVPRTAALGKTPVLSLIVTAPSAVVYQLHSEDLPTKEQISTAISSAMDEVGSEKVLAFISDLTPDIQSCWESLRSKYPGLLTFGCIYQGLNSLLNELLSMTPIQDLCQKGKIVVDRIKGNDVLKKRFQEVQRQLKLAPVSSFKFSNKCKWSSLAKSLALFNSQKIAFQQLVNCDESKDVFQCEEFSYKQFLSFMQNEKFWDGIASITNIIVPLSNWIKLMDAESTSAPSVSLVPWVFQELKSAYESNIQNLPVSAELQQEISRQLNHTKRLCMNELHYAACLLHPKLKLKGILTPNEQEEGMEFLHYFCETRDFHAQKALDLLSDYRKNEGVFKNSQVWKSAEGLDPINWWNSVQPGSTLTQVASQLLRIVPSLASVDLSTITPVLPSNGCDLGIEKANQLNFVRYHLQNSKASENANLFPPPLSSGDSSSNFGRDWMSQAEQELESPQFNLEDEEPMDVTQFLSQNTEMQGEVSSSESDAEEPEQPQSNPLNGYKNGNSLKSDTSDSPADATSDETDKAMPVVAAMIVDEPEKSMDKETVSHDLQLSSSESDDSSSSSSSSSSESSSNTTTKE